MSLFRRTKYDHFTDEELVLTYKRYTKSAIIGELYKRYGHMVMGTSMKYLRNKFDAEDITMHIFEKLPTKILKNDIEKFGGWLYQVTRNECLMKLRKKKIEYSEPSIEVSLEEEDAIESKIALEKRIYQLTAAINELKPEQKECIEMFYIQKMSYDQISTVKKVDLKAVKSSIQNGKRNLKIIMERNDEK